MIKNEYTPITQTYTVTWEQDITELEKCLLILRNVAKNYPRHFDIAIQALEREYQLPPEIQGA